MGKFLNWGIYTHYEAVWDAPASQTAISPALSNAFIPSHFGLGIKSKEPMPHTNVSLFSQLLTLIERNIFHKVVNKHQRDKYNKGIHTWSHLVSTGIKAKLSNPKLRVWF